MMRLYRVEFWDPGFDDAVIKFLVGANDRNHALVILGDWMVSNLKLEESDHGKCHKMLGEKEIGPNVRVFGPLKFKDSWLQANTIGAMEL
jgi:hypothetical protein